MTKEVLKLALEALEAAKELAGKYDAELEYGFQHAITAIKEALAQPAQRTWVGLTSAERAKRADCWCSSAVQTAINIEATLKEKNL